MDHYDVAIVGAGPAGLSAALVLGRCLRRVIVFDSGKPRNYAARQVNCYLAADGLSPAELRTVGRRQAAHFGVVFQDDEVVAASCRQNGGFVLSTEKSSFATRKLLLASGMQDHLPDISGLKELYGTSVHHCPYCDCWEHRDQRLLALARGDSVVELAIVLRGWSTHVTACCSGELPGSEKQALLTSNQIPLRVETPIRLGGEAQKLSEVIFDCGPPLPCEALFFSSPQGQHSCLPKMLGCETTEKDQVETNRKQGTGVKGLFLAGDADGEVQFAIVAAAEGATAATAINRELQEENCGAHPKAWAN